MQVKPFIIVIINTNSKLILRALFFTKLIINFSTFSYWAHAVAWLGNKSVGNFYLWANDRGDHLVSLIIK